MPQRIAQPDSDILDFQVTQTTAANGTVTRKRRVRLPVAVAMSLATLAVGGGAATGISRYGQNEALERTTQELATLRSTVESLGTSVSELRTERAELKVKLENATKQLDRMEMQLQSLNEYLRRH